MLLHCFKFMSAWSFLWTKASFNSGTEGLPKWNTWEIMEEAISLLDGKQTVFCLIAEKGLQDHPMSLERHGSFYLSLGVTLTWHIPLFLLRKKPTEADMLAVFFPKA